jgi:Peptidase inhibitor family I36
MLRSLRRPRTLAFLVGLAGFVAAGLMSASADAGTAAVSRPSDRHQATARIADSSCQDDLAVEYWACVWSRTGFRGTKWEFGSGLSSYSSLGRANDRGESITDRGGGRAMRVYHDTRFRGAWVCIPDGRWIYNLGHYVFNNGAGRPGYGQLVARNFKSIGFSNSRCTKPI